MYNIIDSLKTKLLNKMSITSLFISIISNFLIFQVLFILESGEHTTELLTENLQILREIKAGEIVVYQYNSKYQIQYFQMTSLYGNPLLYGFYTSDITTLNINEKDIPHYLSLGLLIDSQKAQDFSLLTFRDVIRNDLSNAQNVVIVYCSSSDFCDYSLIFYSSNELFFSFYSVYPLAIFDIILHNKSSYILLISLVGLTQKEVNVSVYSTVYLFSKCCSRNKNKPYLPSLLWKRRKARFYMQYNLYFIASFSTFRKCLLYCEIVY